MGLVSFSLGGYSEMGGESTECGRGDGTSGYVQYSVRQYIYPSASSALQSAIMPINAFLKHFTKHYVTPVVFIRDDWKLM